MIRPLRADPPSTFRILACACPSLAGSAKLSIARAEGLICVYQNIDPEAARTAAINAERIVADVSRLHGPTPSGWGMLDYEVPFDEILGEGPGHPEHAVVVGQMVAAIRRARQAFPNVRWTYYGIPGLSYWPGGRLWVTASPEAQRTEIDRQIACYGPVLRECDWFMPCVYDVQRNGSIRNPEWRAANAANERVYRIARIGVANESLRREGLSPRPVFPAVCPFYCGGGNVTETALVPDEEFVGDQLVPCADAADGVAIWAAPTWMVHVATRSDDGTDLQEEFRAFFRRDLLGGIEPDLWTSAETKKTLDDRISSLIASRASLARATANARRGKPAGPTTERGANAPKEIA